MSTLRDELRAKLLATRKPKSIKLDFFGQTIEIRQPTLGEILSARDTDDRQAAVIQILVGNAYVPGSDEKIFESGDKEALLGMPFGNDFVDVTKALESLTAVNFLEQGQNSGQIRPLAGSSESGTPSAKPNGKS